MSNHHDSADPGGDAMATRSQLDALPPGTIVMVSNPRNRDAYQGPVPALRLPDEIASIWLWELNDGMDEGIDSSRTVWLVPETDSYLTAAELNDGWLLGGRVVYYENWLAAAVAS